MSQNTEPAGTATPGALPLAGQHALVTGAGRGIGASVAEHLAALGARVTLMSRTEKTLRAQADAMSETGADVAVAAADVTDEAAVKAGFAEATKAFGPVGILVNNAGRGDSAPFKRSDRAFFQKMIDMNLMSAVLCSHQVLPAMVTSISQCGVNHSSFTCWQCRVRQRRLRVPCP